MGEWTDDGRGVVILGVGWDSKHDAERCEDHALSQSLQGRATRN
ncbi:hypothetical protein Plim_0098 [Planctopirus limnophila DSM 3776]|uniref:Uncharacterized protein n=1 Tax=Planctopirus limnophila (strain ATCC 43296 / DSM 3776 / IFAM 1008 / Mu 290) TaxID=521674 RepID=D5SN24_PLAL2|nr:hypothetical protein Plim_0098 [Planctopirus limnophila DSM 3776]